MTCFLQFESLIHFSKNKKLKLVGGQEGKFKMADKNDDLIKMCRNEVFVIIRNSRSFLLSIMI